MLRFLLKRKIIVMLFVIFIFGYGLYGITKLDKELFPPISFDQTLIMIETEDMPAEDVEQFITIPIEQSLDSMQDVNDYESTSSVGESVIAVNSETGKGEEVTKDIESQVHSITNDIHGVRDVFVMQASTSQSFEFFLDLSGGNLTEMSSFAKNVIQPRLESLSEVREVAVAGLEEKEIVITLKTEKLEDYGLSQDEIIPLIQQMNTNTSIGSFEDEAGKPTLRWNTTFNDIDDIKRISFQTNEGIKRLTDIASVKEEIAEQKNVAWKNGDPEFLLLQVGRADGYTQIDMTEAVRAEIKKINEEHSNGISISEIAAQADYVTSAIEGVVDNILIGGIIAIIVLLLFLRNIRATFIIGLSIPTSILLTILTMTLLDYSFNLLSLIGLGLGIGMMVDASIVVLESIFKKKEQGLSNLEAVVTGTKEVAAAVLSSMLTTIVVFVPIVLLDDDVGKMMIILTVVIAVTLISSVIIAFTVIPSLAENFLRVKKKKTKGKLQLIEKYGKILAWMTRKKRRRIGIIGLFIAMFISSFLLLAKVPMTFMPDIMNRYAEVIVELEPGVTPSERAEIAAKMNEQLETIPDVENNIIMDNMGVMFAIVHMTPAEEKTMEQNEVNEQILQKFRELERKYPVTNVGSAMDGMTSLPVEVQVSGENLQTLQHIGEKVTNELKQIDHVVSVKMQVGENTEEFSVQLNEKNMKDDEITASYVSAQLSQMFSDSPVSEFRQNGETVSVILKNDLSIKEKKQLLQKEIMTANGEKKLSNYVSLEKVSSLSQIDRYNGERYINVTADIEGKDLGSVNLEVQKAIQNMDIDDGYAVSLGGDLEEQQKAFQDLLVIFAISLFLVFVVMAIQFNSFKHPIIILFIIPLTITGVIIGLFLTQKELNLMSGIGVIMLVGIVLNNGILLIDRVKQIRNEGKNVKQAIVDAGKDRIRPIFMTTLTTVGGMLPLAFASGTSSDYQSPLAVVIISGLLFSTFISLLLIPAVYLFFEDIGNGFSRIFKRKKSKKLSEVKLKAQ
ncbi:efflux RND transporter permease subunit [Pseudogracilibacillus auburnensis]|uniref:HAE1 family hydrophobic/amphiphilic exporter-1 n=1 Tax=Pseudogracilibacillus auburnensis TaxID=1494959 RepID=A0A2V3VZM2_9BACI|nr:efflux RND transporter permease subunit [Pseudogracilibacillus auburnensis]PXW87507.1 HAE1 family hydrophobic/amphiphilic exporter-1 [Pseudogracilibacillus auburnensis]